MKSREHRARKLRVPAKVHGTEGAQEIFSKTWPKTASRGIGRHAPCFHRRKSTPTGHRTSSAAIQPRRPAGLLGSVVVRCVVGRRLRVHAPVEHPCLLAGTRDRVSRAASRRHPLPHDRVRPGALNHGAASTFNGKATRALHAASLCSAPASCQWKRSTSKV